LWVGLSIEPHCCPRWTRRDVATRLFEELTWSKQVRNVNYLSLSFIRGGISTHPFHTCGAESEGLEELEPMADGGTRGSLVNWRFAAPALGVRRGCGRRRLLLQGSCVVSQSRQFRCLRCLAFVLVGFCPDLAGPIMDGYHSVNSEDAATVCVQYYTVARTPYLNCHSTPNVTVPSTKAWASSDLGIVSRFQACFLL
jgi:hypothetical protein